MCEPVISSRRGSRAAATSKIEHFVIIVNGWKPLSIITKSSILDVAAVHDPLQAMPANIFKFNTKSIRILCKINITVMSKKMNVVDLTFLLTVDNF